MANREIEKNTDVDPGPVVSDDPVNMVRETAEAEVEDKNNDTATKESDEDGKSDQDSKSGFTVGSSDVLMEKIPNENKREEETANIEKKRKEKKRKEKNKILKMKIKPKNKKN